MGSLSYAFGPSLANTAVQVQVVGGEQSWNGVLDIKVGGISQGMLTGDTDVDTADLLTFSNSTDSSGNLVLDVNLDSPAGTFYGIAGVFVTAEVAVPEPSSAVVLGLGTIGLVVRRRRRA